MGYNRSPFGEGGATGAGNVTTAVSNHYGPRESGQTKGVIKTEGAMKELVIEFTGAEVSAGAFDLLAPTLPAGAVIEDVYVKVKEAFDLGGTTPVVDIGTETSEATNGFSFSEANLESTGTLDLTSALSGTWAAPLAAATTVGILLGGGGTNTSAATGAAKVVIRYAVVGA